MLFILILLPAALSQTPTRSFFSGFAQGTRKSISAPSQCYISLESLPALYSTFESASTFSTSLYSFKSFINTLNSSMMLCKFETLLSEIAYYFVPSNMQELQTKILLNLNTYFSFYNSSIAAYSSKDYYTSGFYAGKIFSLLFNYNL